MNSTSNISVIVLSGYNQRAVISFLRTLTQNGITPYIIARDSEDTILSTVYKSDVFAIRKNRMLDFDEITGYISCIQSKVNNRSVMIAPTTESLNRFLLDNRLQLEGMGCVIPITRKETYEAISDKFSFTEICKDFGLNIPREITDITAFTGPLVAKPRSYIVNGRIFNAAPVLIKNPIDYNNFLLQYRSQLNEFYYQEFIPGESYYLFYYFDQGDNAYRFSQENLVQQSKGKSIIAAVSSSFHESVEADTYERLFRSLQYRGLVMVEVKRYRGSNYMIEANPRFWGPSQLFVDANYNFFELMLYDLGVTKACPLMDSVLPGTKYFWFGGLIDTVSNGEDLTFHGQMESSTFWQNLQDWVTIDVHKRYDTLKIFESEFYGTRKKTEAVLF